MAPSRDRVGRILVLGACGRIGREAARDLVATSAFREILLADLPGAGAGALARALGGGRVRGVDLDARDREALCRRMRRAGVVLSCMALARARPIAQAAIEAGAHYLDLGGQSDTTAMLRLDAAARRAGVTVVPGAGLTPGVSNVLARALGDRLGGASRVEVCFASFRPVAQSPGLLDTILDEFASDETRAYYHRGRFVEVGPFSGRRTVAFELPIGRQTVYLMPHSEVETLPACLGVRHASVRGCWHPQVMGLMRRLARRGQLDARGRRAVRARLLADPPRLPGPFGFYLRVHARGPGGRLAMTTRHARWGEHSTARATGVPASTFAQLVAAGAARRAGVTPPEIAFDPATVLRALRPKGIVARPRDAGR